MKDPYVVIKSLLQTEKGTALAAENKYLFHVDKKANKLDVKKAVETVYKVHVRSVNMISVRGKKKRVRYIQGKTPDWKKAVVTLEEGQKIGEIG